MNVYNFSVNVATPDRTIVSIKDYPVYDNHITFLFGESGIGKSLISKALYGLLDTSELAVTINDTPYADHLKSKWLTESRANSFFVFQEPSSHLNPLMKISEQLNEGSLDCGNERDILEYLWQHSNEDALDTILDVYPKPYRPSGGEKQRILLAMAFKKIQALIGLNDRDLSTYFVFDEPTGSLDNRYRNLFLRLLLDRYCKRQFTAVIITHDYSIISEIYNQYRSLVPYIHFKELSRVDTTEVRVDDFSPDNYLSWLNSSRWSSVQNSLQNKPVLEFGSDFSIFSRNLRIYQDRELTQPSPLIINKGSVVYLKAPSGVGKTTIAKIILGIYKADSFSMKLCGKNYSTKTHQSAWTKHVWGKQAGMVFQHADESLNLQATVKETFDGLRGRMQGDLDTLLGQLFTPKTIEAIKHKKTAFLSGGQKQRLNLLRTLALNTDLVIFDEPLNGLDFVNVKKVLELLNQLRMNGTAILMISHNEEIFEALIGEENILYLAEVT